MQVYLLPVGGKQYELYCDVAPDAAVRSDEGAQGVWPRLVARFRAVLTAIEHEEQRRHQEHTADEGERPSLGTRLKRRLLRWMAERIAGQRLLWHLRRVARATATYPDDLAEADARAHLFRMLGRDRDRHRLWAVVNAAGFIASGVLMPIPGPNLVAYYFAFRLVGHFLSLRGAQNGLTRVEWALAPNSLLVALRQAAALEPAARDRQVHEIAERLGLPGLPRFYLRTAVAGA